jgi:hypothetical protein
MCDRYDAEPVLGTDMCSTMRWRRPKIRHLLRGFGVGASVFSIAGCVKGGARLAMISPEPVQNFGSACDTSRNAPRDPAERGARLSVEVIDRRGPFNDGGVETVSDIKGMPLVSVACAGLWAHFILAPGRYHVATVLGSLQSNTITVNLQSTGAQVTLMMPYAPNPGVDARDVVP